MNEPLSRLVIATAARAAGCWRLANGYLTLVGFGCVSDMPEEVRDGFQQATRRVSLDQLGLGIVNAVVTNKPTIARRDPGTTGLDGSASWIVKFDANTSLAIPIHDRDTDRIVGALAVSTAAFIEEGDALWQTLLEVSNQLRESAKI